MCQGIRQQRHTGDTEFPGASSDSGRKTPSQGRWIHDQSFQADAVGLRLQSDLSRMSLSPALLCTSQLAAGRGAKGQQSPESSREMQRGDEEEESETMLREANG